MSRPLQITNPKRSHSGTNEWDALYPYYAGFPESFAFRLLGSAGLPANALVLDPWNGSGTTTKAAASLGLDAVGVDLNPVMLIVAKARLLSPSEADSLLPIAHSIVQIASKVDRADLECDPLRDWFDAATAKAIRGLERAIRSVASGGLEEAGIVRQPLTALSSLAALYYVALFSVARKLSTGLRSSNPTWLRSPKAEGEKLTCDIATLHADFLRTVAGATSYFSMKGADQIQGKCDLRNEDCRTVKIRGRLADFLLTSPPYCTRIDYAHLTKVELAVLAPLFSRGFLDLRLAMTGTTLTSGRKHGISWRWGDTCRSFLGHLRAHPSRASRGYYFNTHSDYFAKMYQSFRQTSLNMKVGGRAVFVVRDSWYKDLHNDLPQILVEMAKPIGFELDDRRDYPIARSFSDIHPSRRGLEQQRPTAETVLIFSRH